MDKNKGANKQSAVACQHERLRAMWTRNGGLLLPPGAESQDLHSAYCGMCQLFLVTVFPSISTAIMSLNQLRKIEMPFQYLPSPLRLSVPHEKVGSRFATCVAGKLDLGSCLVGGSGLGSLRALLVRSALVNTAYSTLHSHWNTHSSWPSPHSRDLPD